MAALGEGSGAAAALAVAALGATLSACAPLVVGGAAVTALVAVDRRTSGAQLDDQGIELRASNRLKDELGDAHARVHSKNAAWKASRLRAALLGRSRLRGR